MSIDGAERLSELANPILSWFPNDAIARACLERFAYLIDKAHATSPVGWALSARNGQRLTLSVGVLVVLRASASGRAKIAVDTGSLDATTKARLEEVASAWTSKTPWLAIYTMPIATLANMLPTLASANERAVELAAKTVKRRTPYHRAHDAATVRWIGARVGRTLPQPSYASSAAETVPVVPPTPVASAPPSTWTPDAVRRAWRSHLDSSRGWSEKALAIATRIQAASADELRNGNLQRALWNARDFAGAGPGDAIDVSSAFTDFEVLAHVERLRRHSWPNEPEACGAELQAEFDQMIARLGQLGLRARPWAKTLRTFAILVPQHLTCLLSRVALGAAVRQLFGRDISGSTIQEHVRIRARLRELLGPEQSLSEHVYRMTFAWRLSEAVPNDLAYATPQTEPLDERAARALQLWPIGRQYAGVPAISGYSATWKEILRAAQAGQTADAIVEEVRQSGTTDADSPKSLRYAVSRLLGLGLLERRGELFWPSADGMQILEGDDEPLVTQLLVRNYGPAQLLRLLEKSARPRAELFEELRRGYPAWTSNFAPATLAAWAVDLGLAEYVEGKTLALTDYGREWHARLPDKLPQPEDEPRAVIEGGIDLERIEVPLRYPAFDEIEARLRADPSARGFVISRDTLRALHAAWTCHPLKHFVILSGLSGTGKTKVLEHYSRAVCSALDIPHEEHHQLVAVSPDWHDPSGLLGYYNPLHSEPTYQIEPALRLVLAAAARPAEPHFLVLDEMNLARVERYFAPFLSAMEEGNRLTIHGGTTAVNGVPPSIPWPRNLFFAGTVNMDESTHAFSDKVLDRAFTLEFWDVDLATYFERRGERNEAAEALLGALHATFAPARRHFGYRTAGEVLDFVRTMVAAGGSMTRALDDAVFSKILPKLRGEDTPLVRKTLEAARKIATEHGLVRSAEKLALMENRLSEVGVTRFWA